MGATMRLGNCDAELREGTLAHQIYGAASIRGRGGPLPPFLAFVEAMKERGMRQRAWG